MPDFIKKETLEQVLPGELRKMFKSTFFIEHLRATASTFVFNKPPK